MITRTVYDMVFRETAIILLLLAHITTVHPNNTKYGRKTGRNSQNSCDEMNCA